MTAKEIHCRHRVAVCEECGWQTACTHFVVHDCGNPTVPSLPATPTPIGGPGTELKKTLARMGITSAESCPCNAHARQMDAWGEAECENRMDEILEWLRLQAESRGLPFIRAAAALLVRMSIRSSRRLKQSQP